jgi:hypothetical protein
MIAQRGWANTATECKTPGQPVLLRISGMLIMGGIIIDQVHEFSPIKVDNVTALGNSLFKISELASVLLESMRNIEKCLGKMRVARCAMVLLAIFGY